MPSVFEVHSSDDLADVNQRSRSARHDRLFRASASAFSCITRPTQRQAKQFEEIALSLYEQVADDTLRYVGALLSNDANAPKPLVMRIAHEPVSISAPLLLRSPVLATADLVLLISNGGIPHARTIGQRANLDPTLRDLLAILNRRAVPQTNLPEEPGGPANPQQDSRAKSVRDQLRATLAANETNLILPVECTPESPTTDHERLIEAALASDPSALVSELARRMSVDQAMVSKLINSPGYLHLVVMLKSLSLGTGDAFAIVAAVSSPRLSGKDAVRLFVERYRTFDLQAAKDRLSDWRALSTIDTDCGQSPVAFTGGQSVEFSDTSAQIAMAS